MNVRGAYIFSLGFTINVWGLATRSIKPEANRRFWPQEFLETQQVKFGPIMCSSDLSVGVGIISANDKTKKTVFVPWEWDWRPLKFLIREAGPPEKNDFFCFF